jgi:putative sigma-54 modulation protein
VEVRVHGKNLQILEDMRALTEEKVAHAGRIFDDGASADVEYEERNNPRISDGRFRVEITSLLAGHTVRVEATAPDERSALDVAVDKFERRLRRLKERIVQRSRQASNKHLNDPEVGSDDIETDGPRIVRTKRFEMRPMVPEEAALQMEMLGHAFFFFLNAETGAPCVLYHRHDGQLGLIEPA